MSWEEEYVSLSSQAKRPWVLIDFIVLKADPKQCVILYRDSYRAIKMSGIQAVDQRNEWIEINYHYIRHAVSRIEISLK